MEFHQPTRLDAALALISADPEAMLLAGGATLVAMMNAELVAPSRCCSLRRWRSGRPPSCLSFGRSQGLLAGRPLLGKLFF